MSNLEMRAHGATPRFSPPNVPSYSRSPSRSPMRPKDLMHYHHDTLLSDLSPSATLEALSAAPTFSDNPQDRSTLEAGIAQATPTARAFGIRAALAWKKLREWQRELSSWDWPEFRSSDPSRGFRPPNEHADVDGRKNYLGNALGVDGGQDEQFGDDVPMSITSTQRLGSSNTNNSVVDGQERWGCLPAGLVTKYGDRIVVIRDELDELDLESLKEQVLNFHALSRPGSSSSAEHREPSTPASHRSLDDFTAITTATVLRTLPHLSALNRLLDIWSTRLCVLSKIATLLAGLQSSSLALESAWRAIGRRGQRYAKRTNEPLSALLQPSKIEPPSESSSPVIDFDRNELGVRRAVIGEHIATSAQQLDSMLDALEGQEDTVPAEWIEKMEAIETDFALWAIEAERIVMAREWPLSRDTDIVEGLAPTGENREDHKVEHLGALNDHNNPLAAGQETDRQEVLHASESSQALTSANTVGSVSQRDSLQAQYDHYAGLNQSMVTFHDDHTAAALAELQTFNPFRNIPTPQPLSTKFARSRSVSPKPEQDLKQKDDHSSASSSQPEAERQPIEAFLTPELSPQLRTPSASVNGVDVRYNMFKSMISSTTGVDGGFAEPQSETDKPSSNKSSLQSIPDIVPTSARASDRQGEAAEESIGGGDDSFQESTSPFNRNSDLSLRLSEFPSGQTQTTVISLPSPNTSTPPSSTHSYFSETSDVELEDATSVIPYNPVVISPKPSSNAGIPTPVNSSSPKPNLTIITDPHYGKSHPGSSRAELGNEKLNRMGHHLLPRQASGQDGLGIDDGDQISVPSRASVASVERISRASVRSIDVRRPNSQISTHSAPPATSQGVIEPQTPTMSPGAEGTGRGSLLSSPLRSPPKQARPPTPTSPPAVDHTEQHSVAPSPVRSPQQQAQRPRPAQRVSDRLHPEDAISPPPVPRMSSRRQSRNLSDGKPSEAAHQRRTPASSSLSPQGHDYRRRSVAGGSDHGLRTGEKKEVQLEKSISSLLSRIPANIRLTSEDQATISKSSQSSGKIDSATSILPQTPLAASAATPTFTLAPAESTPDQSSKSQNGNSEVQLYHLRQVGNTAPIKLFVRLIGGNSERVMVRVGGGWADLGEYLREYAAHHGHRSISDGRKVEFRDLGAGNSNTSSPLSSSSARGSARNTPGSGNRIASTPLNGQQNGLMVNKVRSASYSPFSGFALDKPPNVKHNGTNFENSPLSGSAQTPAQYPRTDNEANTSPSISLGGSKRRGKGFGSELTPEKQKWVDGMMGEMRRTSAGPTGGGVGDELATDKGSRANSNSKVGFGELGKVGGIRRIFKKGD
ncbi:MAG: hypothetical protein M1833_001424 [Piccolia ochrophora]|nr:MAG: hypothetical protein M1833_001424 [Piccolia ochrophora]